MIVMIIMMMIIIMIMIMMFDSIMTMVMMIMINDGSYNDDDDAQGAEVVIWNPDGSRRSKSVLSSRDGEYWRVLVPGPPGNNTYTVQVI